MSPATDVRPAIEAANKQFMEIFRRGDAAGVARLYTADGEALPPNSDAIRGTQALEAFWKQIMTLGLEGVTLQTVEVDVQGSTAIETGRYTLTLPGGAVADQGKYLVVWKNEGGSWRLHRDIWATSQPAAAPAAS